MSDTQAYSSPLSQYEILSKEDMKYYKKQSVTREIILLCRCGIINDLKNDV